MGAGRARSACGCGYVSAAAGTPLEGLRPRDKSVLQQVDTEASVAVDKSMLEHLKACGHG